MKHYNMDSEGVLKSNAKLIFRAARLHTKSMQRRKDAKTQRHKDASVRVEMFQLERKIHVTLMLRKPISIAILLMSPRIRNEGQPYSHRLWAPGALRFNVFTQNKKGEGLEKSQRNHRTIW